MQSCTVRLSLHPSLSLNPKPQHLKSEPFTSSAVHTRTPSPAHKPKLQTSAGRRDLQFFLRFGEASSVEWGCYRNKNACTLRAPGGRKRRKTRKTPLAVHQGSCWSLRFRVGVRLQSSHLFASSREGARFWMSLNLVSSLWQLVKNLRRKIGSHAAPPRK